MQLKADGKRHRGADVNVMMLRQSQALHAGSSGSIWLVSLVRFGRHNTPIYHSKWLRLQLERLKHYGLTGKDNGGRRMPQSFACYFLPLQYLAYVCDGVFFMILDLDEAATWS